MFSHASQFLRSCLLVTLVVLAGSTLAQQSEFVEAGSLVATIDGVDQTTHPYDVHAQTADGVQFAPGATFMYMKEVSLGDMVLTPAYFHITVLTYNRELVNNQQGAIDLNILVDPETLELTQLEDLRITYYPNGMDPEKIYVLSEGELKLDPIRVIDEDTWHVSGTIEGYVSRQESYNSPGDPNDKFHIVARFEFPQVKRQESPF
ncbi:MAG: hypothetical protein WDA03_11820 [Trueperaceae bacterium]